MATSRLMLRELRMTTRLRKLCQIRGKLRSQIGWREVQWQMDLCFQAHQYLETNRLQWVAQWGPWLAVPVNHLELAEPSFL
mmetsp:Transcript_76392/g.220788  ORF Transcript_76392/g.220788 Transcript_76392/m.220788 type:complete len:81 (+) Transcript_76392:123-365(+)